MMNLRLARPDHLIDLNELSELDYVRDTGDGVEVGAMTRHRPAATDPASRARPARCWRKAAATIGHYAIRQRGTLGGSLAHADPAAQLAADGGAARCRAPDAARARGRSRSCRRSDFFQSVMTTALDPDEILIVAVRFPMPPPRMALRLRDLQSAPRRLRHRARGRHCWPATAWARSAIFGLQSAASLSTPVRFDAVMARFVGGASPDATWIESAGPAVETRVEAEETRISGTSYRRELVQVLTQRATAAALTRTREGGRL